jgi:hypothetical protein
MAQVAAMHDAPPPDDDRSAPRKNPPRAADKAERLAAQLRANLRRRKEQARAMKGE